MKYVIKKIIIGVSIGLILMFIGNIIPKADSYSKASINNAVCASGYNCSSFNRNYIYYTFLKKDVISSENFRMNFDAINLVPYDGFKITTIMSEYNQQYFEVYSAYPSVFEWYTQQSESYVITYADGTQAIVNGATVITGWDAVAVAEQGYQYGNINDTTFAYQLNYITGTNTNNACIMESANHNQITWNCPKTSSASELDLTGLVLNVRYRTDLDMTLYINRTDILLYRNDGSRIITKIDQSTQSIINSINSGNQGTQNAINQNTQATQEQTNTIKSDDVSGASSSAESMVNNSAYNDSVGLDSIIKLPLNFINSLSNTCQPINLTVPYMNFNISIPCIQSVINNYMPALVVVIKTFVNGLIIYRILLELVDIIKGAKNPNDDRLEVLEL